MIITFSWTTDALLAGFKTCTRRNWSPRTLATVQRQAREGRLFDAYDRSTRQHGKKVATIRIVGVPDWSRDLPEQDWHNEGFDWLSRYRYTLDGAPPVRLWTDWHRHRPAEVVVRFEIVEWTPYGRQLRALLKAEGKEVR